MSTRFFAFFLVVFVYGDAVGKTKPIPVRLGESELARLDHAAKAMSNTRSGMIRFAVITFLEDFEREGIRGLSPNWREVMASGDGRRNKAAYPPSSVSAFSMNDCAGAVAVSVETIHKKDSPSAKVQSAAKHGRSGGKSAPK